MSPLTAPRPNVLIVLFDCGRADDFPPNPAAVPDMPFTSQIVRESAQFPLAVSPAPWTIPSHASLFTGLYPWEHGVHAKHSLELGVDLPSLPTALKSAGYRTMALSGNHLVSADLGLLRGFDRSAWAGWWEPYYRTGATVEPPHSTGSPGGSSYGQLKRLQAGGAWKLLKRTSRLVYRYPFAMDALGRVTQRLRHPERDPLLGMSTWIEPTLRGWVASTPADVPVFAFINLLDVHEPYYPPSGLAPGFTDWMNWSRVRQDHVGWLSGAWDPTPDEFARLHALYRSMRRTADRRLEQIVRVFQEAGRWENTTLVVTSDHGQAFGEHDMLFHMLRLQESLVRIPLFVRRPDGRGAGSQGKGWASLVDVPPTVLGDAWGRPSTFGSGQPLDPLLAAPRRDPVYTIADGLVWKAVIPEHERKALSDARERELDRVMVAAYQGERKLVVCAGNPAPQIFDVGTDPAESIDLWPTEGPRFAELASSAHAILDRIQGAVAAPPSADVEDRLRSWGYL